jgi:hypothetical protein
MPNKGQGAEGRLFADLGKLFYDWHKKDPNGLICEKETDECNMEIERLVELIDYVAMKRGAAR